jgi:glycerol uptake facilitator-like aquaporin
MSSNHHEHVPDFGTPAHRLATQELEIGVTDAIQRHATRHVVAPKPVSQRKLDFEHSRPRWLREMAAEALGVFMYVYPGIASQGSFFVNNTEPVFGSLFQIGFAYAMGIAFAIITCGPTSGGHFNPAVTIALAVWQGFPWYKVPYYIFSQIFGSFLAGLVLMGQYKPQLDVLAATCTAAGRELNSLGCPGSVLVSFPGPTETNYGYLFMIEFFVDSFIVSTFQLPVWAIVYHVTLALTLDQGIVIWAVLDPANPFVSPSAAPFIIGMAYANMIWGFANLTISTNLARDLGTRFVAAIFYGGSTAFTKYAAISILVNIPATLFATLVYEIIQRDSFLAVAKGHAEHEDGGDGLVRHLTKTGTLSEGEGGGYISGNGGLGLQRTREKEMV